MSPELDECIQTFFFLLQCSSTNISNKFLSFSSKGSKGERGADGETGQKGDQVRTYFVKNLKRHHCFSQMNFILPFLTSPLGSPLFEVGIFLNHIFMVSILIPVVHCHLPLPQLSEQPAFSDFLLFCFVLLESYPQRSSSLKWRSSITQCSLLSSHPPITLQVPVT